MRPGRSRVLYLDSYTVSDPRQGAPSSDAIGYGITASGALTSGLAASGFDIVHPLLPASLPASPAGEGPVAQLRWLVSSYAGVLDAFAQSPPDLVFSFHIFKTFPVEIRRMLLDLGLTVPIVGYTHGSHWDPTDAFRFQAYPGMELLDLANLHALDRILLVSEYMRSTLWDNIAAFNKPLAEQLDAKAAVVGLPLDTDRIDACRTSASFERTTIVFNHAPVSSKNPELFVRVMRRVLRRYDVTVLVTRKFRPGQPGAAALAELAADHPDHVVLGQDMPLDDYYRALWMSDLQVSTATHESLGVSTLEAMYTGNCCILPRLGSYPEVCGDHPEVLYELGEEQLEERLGYFLDHPERRRSVAAQLRRRTDRYRPEEVVDRIAKVLLEL